MKGFIDEFKAFAMKGNVIDLAVAVVIGAAFGKIVTSLVENIITPFIGVLMGGKNFSGLAYTLGNAEITYGVFIQSIIDFLIVAFFIFLAVKAVNKAQDAFDGDEGEVPATPPEPSEEVKLLREIRDSLKR
jgi:large conductance mechanosensitive channel